MSEEVGFPKTSDGGSNFMQPGLQRMRIDKMIKWVGKDGKPREDPRGYPGMYITLVNEQNQYISDGFYYSEQPLDHPSRNDDNLKCKSEYFLTNLKTALGFKPEQSPTLQEIKSKWCWGAVGIDVLIDGSGQPTGKSFSFLAKKFFPDGIRPAIAGDPMLPQSGGIASGIFRKESMDRTKATTTTAPPERSAPATQAEAPSDVEDDMPVEDF